MIIQNLFPTSIVSLGVLLRTAVLLIAPRAEPLGVPGDAPRGLPRRAPRRPPRPTGARLGLGLRPAPPAGPEGDAGLLPRRLLRARLLLVVFGGGSASALPGRAAAGRGGARLLEVGRAGRRRGPSRRAAGRLLLFLLFLALVLLAFLALGGRGFFGLG